MLKMFDMEFDIVYFSLVLKYGRNSMDMSFTEKSAWISFVSTLCIFGYYFIQVIGLSGLPAKEASEAAIRLLAYTIVLSVIVETVFHAMLAATNRKAAEMGADERDSVIQWKANQVGYTILVVGVMIVIGRLLIVELNPSFADQNSSINIPMLTAHILMFSFVLSEVARFGSQIFYYRRGY